MVNAVADRDQHLEVLAGLVVLRLLDKWEAPGTAADDRSWQADFRPVKDAIDALKESAAKRALSALFDAIHEFSYAQTQDGNRLARLSDYAEVLETTEYWELAADCYGTAIDVINRSGRESKLLLSCYERSAYCVTQLGQLNLAHELLAEGIAAATDPNRKIALDDIEIDYWLVRLRIQIAVLEGQLLLASGEWETAAAMYSGAIDLIRTRADARPLLYRCCERAAYCLRQIGRIEEAEDFLGEGLTLAAESGDTYWTLYLRISSAVVERQKGNPPDAEHALEEVIEGAKSANATELLARAKHELGLTVYERNRDAHAVELYHEAAAAYADRSLKRRALMDLAVALADLGRAQGDTRHLERARKVCRLLRRAPDDGMNSRALAGLNLIRFAFLAGDRDEFENLRVGLENAKMPGRLLAHYHAFVGQGQLHFGDVAAARVAFERAIQVARTFGVNKLLVDVESLLSATDDRRIVWQEPERDAVINRVAADIDADRGVFAGATWN